MGRPSKQPQIKQDHIDYPQLTYEQLAKKNECSIRTVYRALDVKVPKNYNVKLAKLNVKKQAHSNSSQGFNEKKDLAQILESIDNPVAFTSAHIFEKMIETGDYRWAQLFVALLEKTNKLDYETIKEEQWLNQAKNMQLSDIVSLVAKRGSISRNISRRLEELDDTSPYENFSDV